MCSLHAVFLDINPQGKHNHADSQELSNRSDRLFCLRHAWSRKGVRMFNPGSRRSPSPRKFGYSLDRRDLLKGAAGAAALGLILPSGFARAQTALEAGTGEVTLGSNYSDPVPQSGLLAAVEALPNKDITVKINEVDHNTFQENITTYLQNPDDVIPWFAGYRMRYFAAQDLLGDITDVWDAGLNGLLAEGFKVASTGDDGKQYLVPWTYYAWGVYYRPSLYILGKK